MINKEIFSKTPVKASTFVSYKNTKKRDWAERSFVKVNTISLTVLFRIVNVSLTKNKDL